MTQPRTKSGKFAKKIENPDCEVATVGYVKRLVCSTRGHTHQQTTHNKACACGAIVGWFIVMSLWFMSIAFRTNLLDSPLGVISAIVSIVCTLVSYDLWETAQLDTDGVSQPIPISFYEWGAIQQEALASWWNSRYGIAECE